MRKFRAPVGSTKYGESNTSGSSVGDVSLHEILGGHAEPVGGATYGKETQ